jgi:hypothetical protein
LDKEIEKNLDFFPGVNLTNFSFSFWVKFCQNFDVEKKTLSIVGKKKNKKENNSLKSEMPLGVGTAIFEVSHILWRADFAW